MNLFTTVYNYDAGNQLQNVVDKENHPESYNDRHQRTDTPDFIYDGYGNLIEDKDKEITEINYNHLNLPVKIAIENGGTIAYIYDALGTKLQKVVDEGSNTTTTQYMDTSTALSTGSFQYTEDQLDFFPHSEGYVKATPMVNGYYYSYVYTHTDHLGNIRMKYTKHPQTGELKILEENHYYPYGLTHNGYNGAHLIVGLEQPGTEITLIEVTPDVTDTHKYKFGGKEYQTEFDVNMYDFGARNYDPALGRWMNVDPLAEDYSSASPYLYALNNPLFFIDPDGREIRNADEERRQAAEVTANEMTETLNLKAEYLGVSTNASRGTWKKAAMAKGGKSEWNATKSVRSWNKDAQKDLTRSTALAEKTQQVIDNFAATAPNMFAVMDNMTNEYGEVVDIMMSSKSMSNHNGVNEFSFESDNSTGEVRVKTSEFGLNTLAVSINTVMGKGEDKKVPTTMDVVRHEMGHANYTIEKTRSYSNYIGNLKKSRKNFKGGHRADDPSGQRANEWQKKKDL